MASINATLMVLRALLGAHTTRLRGAIDGRDRGASAVELAIITAIILGIAIALLTVIGNFVGSESGKIHG